MTQSLAETLIPIDGQIISKSLEASNNMRNKHQEIKIMKASCFTCFQFALTMKGVFLCARNKCKKRDFKQICFFLIKVAPISSDTICNKKV